MSQPAIAVPTPRPDADGGARHLEVVPEPSSRHVLVYTLVGLVIAGAAVFGAVSLNALAAEQAVEAEQLQTRVTQAQRNHTALVARVGRLEDPDRIRGAARELGMIAAPSRRYLETEQTLPGDARRSGEAVRPGASTDPLKPVLSVQR